MFKISIFEDNILKISQTFFLLCWSSFKSCFLTYSRLSNSNFTWCGVSEMKKWDKTTHMINTCSAQNTIPTTYLWQQKNERKDKIISCNIKTNIHLYICDKSNTFHARELSIDHRPDVFRTFLVPMLQVVHLRNQTRNNWLPWRVPSYTSILCTRLLCSSLWK